MLSTVDQKQIGKRCIATSIFFLLIGGIEALIMRIQLAPRPGDSRPGNLQPYLQHARHGYNLLVRVPHLVGPWRLPCAVDDRFPRSGVPAFQCFHLLEVLLTIDWRSRQLHCHHFASARAGQGNQQDAAISLQHALTVSFVTVFSLPSLTATNVFLELDRRWATHFSDVARHGNVLLWQHLF